MGEAIITYRGANIFLNGIKITMDSQGRMRWGNRFLFKSSTNNLYGHGRNFQNASGIDFKNYHYSGNLQGVARMKEMGKVMGTATKRLAGKADGSAISALVRQLLG